MKIFELKEIIANRLPYLIEINNTTWKKNESLRRQFVKDFPKNRILDLALDEFVIGKGGKNRSFCYRIERELNTLGSMRGANARKFGIYYSKDENDYVTALGKWGGDSAVAFRRIKESIVELLKAAHTYDTDRIISNKLSPMFRGKILFLYYPKKFLPIFSNSHLQYFADCLNISLERYNDIYIQEAILEFRNNFENLRDLNVYAWTSFLYDFFEIPKKGRFDAPQKNLSLKQKIKHAQFIENIPRFANVSDTQGGRDRGRADYVKINQYRKWVGDRGEKIVFNMERKRLIEGNREDLADKVSHVAEKDDSKGFDILSYDINGDERYIEVKATNAPDFRNGFYLSANEKETAESLDNYYIYIVFSAGRDNKSPSVLPVSKSSLFGRNFAMSPRQFHVTAST